MSFDSVRVASCQLCGTSIVRRGRSWVACEIPTDWIDFGIPIDDLPENTYEARMCDETPSDRQMRHRAANNVRLSIPGEPGRHCGWPLGRESE